MQSVCMISCSIHTNDLGTPYMEGVPKSLAGIDQEAMHAFSTALST